MDIVKKYVNGLKEAYYNENGKNRWDHFEKIKHGVNIEDSAKLKKLFHNIPDSLLNLLEY